MISLDHGDVAGHVLTLAVARSRTLTDALAVLTALPLAMHPLSIRALLSRSFPTFTPSVLITHGHWNRVQDHAPAYIVAAEGQAVLSALARRFRDDRAGFARAFEWYAELDRAVFSIPPSSTTTTESNEEVEDPPRSLLHSDRFRYSVVCTALADHLPAILAWLDTDLPKSDHWEWPLEEAHWDVKCWYRAVLGGHIESVLWGEVQGLYAIDTARMIRLAFTHNHVSILDWCLRNRRDDVDAVVAYESFGEELAKASAEAYMGVLGWWWNWCQAYQAETAGSNGFPGTYIYVITRAAASSGSTAPLNWWWQRYFVRHLKRHPFMNKDGLIAAAAATDGAKVLDWIWQKSQKYPTAFDFKWDKLFAAGAFPSPPPTFAGNTDISLPALQWWHAKSIESSEGHAMATWLEHQATACAAHGRVDVLDWVWDRRPDRTTLTKDDQPAPLATVHWGSHLVLAAFQHCQLGVLQWCWTHRADLPAQDSVTDMYAETLTHHRHHAPGPKSLALYQWWSTHHGFSHDDLLGIGKLVAAANYAPAVEWWVAQLGALAPCASPMRALDAMIKQALMVAAEPVVLDVLAAFVSKYHRRDQIDMNKIARTRIRPGVLATNVLAVYWWRFYTRTS